MGSRKGVREPISDDFRVVLQDAMREQGMDAGAVAETTNDWIRHHKWATPELRTENIANLLSGRIRSCTYLYPLKKAMGIRDEGWRVTHDSFIVEAVDLLNTVRAGPDRDRLPALVGVLRQAVEKMKVARKAAEERDELLGDGLGASMTEEKSAPSKQPK